LDGGAAGASPPVPHRVLQPLSYLEAEHDLVLAVGIAPDTALHFGAGYAPRGIMRGRLAIPIHDRDGKLLAYCGRAVKDESPTLIFPNGFNPASVIFNADRIGTGELYLVRDPLQVLAAHQSGIDNVVAFLTDGISAQQLEMLAALMDETGCDTVQLF
jgi:DNA primase